ncbi:cytochrome b562 [Vibrio salinus]|uniref:cytochrome b562 n=1 Tax=Vibrio salinus TaxID=2899784 RepID=UPI001E3D8C97|nr:cytochrome b562 [Vibrio salinus]MCE0495344.1 cytochrome b562 [Vibrio salinus]
MKKTLVLIAAALLSANIYAHDDDLGVLMHGFKTEFRDAANASSVDEMKAAVMKFDDLVEQAKKLEYPPKKEATFQDGYQKLSVALDKVEMALDKGDLKQAKSELKNVDMVRREFHRKLR